MSVSSERAVVFLDNGYLSAILRDEFNKARIDYLLLSETICKGYRRLRTYVYDCLPYQGNPPSIVQKTLYSGKQKFFNALRKLPSFEVRFGKQRPRSGGFVQKGVDVLLSIDMVRLGAKGQIQKAFLIAGDGDFAPVVRATKDEGVSVKLYHSGNFTTTSDGRSQPKYSNELWNECDEREIITKDLIDCCRF